ncbi:MAG: decarboxylating NADP(+)-dependent phosphogluconate dehydrogenase [Pleomorphochaeta sp.]
MKASIGLIGLAVMGENLVLNMERNGYSVAVFNRTTSRVDNFMATRAKGKNIIPTYSLEELVSKIERPRKIMIMVKAGAPVDSTIDQLIPLLDKQDIIIDGGNSNYKDTERRAQLIESKGLYFIGTGVSGGEEGALMGPSLMPGGSEEAWKSVKPIFQSIAAKAGNDNKPCCNWIGKGGAGHFVKMVHNGIEYGDMQLICEIYDIMRKALKMPSNEIAEVFKEWNQSELQSYLIEITSDILCFKDEDGSYLVDNILDTAGQKGTGKWTGINALMLGSPLTLISESVFSRCLSSQKDERKVAENIFNINLSNDDINYSKATIIENLKKALYAAKIISYAQGFDLIKKAGKENSWNLNLGEIALLWRGGCIIRSQFLDKIKDAYTKDQDLMNLILDPYFSKILIENQSALRKTISLTVELGIPLPALSAALSWFDGYRCNNLPTNLLQAQRDYFGAHTYERCDKDRGNFYHTNWTGTGGSTSSSSYNI